MNRYKPTIVPSAEEPDHSFYDRADAHIRLANKHGDEVGHGKASASFLYAASRYNAFVVASQSGSAGEMRADRAAAVDYFVDQYRRMLDDNLDEYIRNFDSNLGRGEV